MILNFESEKPIHLQISDEIEDAIFTGAIPEETRIPTTTEISLGFQVKPATVLKGINILADSGVVYKRRGIGMFVSKGAKEKIKQKRQDIFSTDYISGIIFEAKKLKISKNELMNMLKSSYDLL